MDNIDYLCIVLALYNKRNVSTKGYTGHTKAKEYESETIRQPLFGYQKNMQAH